jgi:AcrR family transcriptional regulator
MGRWEPNARGRLEQAAHELFRKRGYDRTTVQDIAARAGLTERTFFRYFADKREVLFWGAATLQKVIVDAIAGAPATVAPLDAVVTALEAGAGVIPATRERARARQDLITAHADLRERELIKLTTLGAAIAEALRARRIREPAASLTAEAGITIFKVAFEGWVRDAGPRDMAHHIHAALGELKAVVAGAAAAPPKARRRKR